MRVAPHETRITIGEVSTGPPTAHPSGLVVGGGAARHSAGDQWRQHLAALASNPGKQNSPSYAAFRHKSRVRTRT